MPAGKYVLRLAFEMDKSAPKPRQVVLSIEQSVPSAWQLLAALFALAIIPFFVAISHFGFEHRRWAESDYNPYGSTSGGDDDE
jgi:hypothetical protein